MRVSLAEINALRNMDRTQLEDRAIEVGGLIGRDFPTNDSLRLAIIDCMIDRVTQLEVDHIDTASKVGAEHFAEAVQLHALSSELERKADEEEEVDNHDGAVKLRRNADRGFTAARSAAAIGQAGLTAAALGAMADVLQGLGKTL
jgi:hypothetical protein